jgi:membrane protein involved in colicin uptake
MATKKAPAKAAPAAKKAPAKAAKDSKGIGKPLKIGKNTPTRGGNDIVMS